MAPPARTRGRYVLVVDGESLLAAEIEVLLARRRGPQHLIGSARLVMVDALTAEEDTGDGGELDAHLTSLQFRLLCYLADRADQVVARSEPHAALHAAPLRPRDRRIDAVVTRIRHKLAASPYRYVHSHRGLGYRFAAVRSG